MADQLISERSLAPDCLRRPKKFQQNQLKPIAPWYPVQQWKRQEKRDCSTFVRWRVPMENLLHTKISLHLNPLRTVKKTQVKLPRRQFWLQRVIMRLDRKKIMLVEMMEQQEDIILRVTVINWRRNKEIKCRIFIQQNLRIFKKLNTDLQILPLEQSKLNQNNLHNCPNWLWIIVRGSVKRRKTRWIRFFSTKVT